MHESTSTTLTRLSLQATASLFPDGQNASWLTAIGPTSIVDIGKTGFLMSHSLRIPWESHEATVLPIRVTVAWLQGCWCPRKIAVQTPTLASHIARVLSAEAVRSRRSDKGRKQTPLTEAVWRRSVRRQRLLFRSHSLAVLSAEQEASKWPLEWKEQPQVGWQWPDSTNTQRPQEKSQSRTCYEDNSKVKRRGRAGGTEKSRNLTKSLHRVSLS